MMTTSGLFIRDLASDGDVALAFDLLRQLRPHLTSQEAFAALVADQRAGGYRLVGGFVGEKLVVVAGYRVSSTLFRGPHLFVDDLVTEQAEQGKGYGQAMIDWLRATAREAGLTKVWLDSRDTAVGFYERCGFTFSTSKPCFIASAD
ncbi:GNAT family N-acetyltransferase [Humisphaera borealis]|uniref:GNAT family N-acetyltransferase n=1 Tax=Humisphaera borealis TaxID=2807512 RepID=A0A7M2WT38_9BACT|nr:GNAT family N-acetyltransferase [Humisphaera borealis]QOV87770.1 GNAT family N-acetyltransferase [Humisphaera borealis]